MEKKVYLECLTKKGISPLIATVLLIGFAITIGAIVFNWSSLFTKDLSTQTSYELASGLKCSKTISLAIEDSCIVGNKVRVTITNKADTTLKGAIIRIINPNNLVNQTDHTIDITPYQTIALDSLYSGLPKDLKDAEITVIPKIDVSGNTEICPGKITKFTKGLCANKLNYGSFEGVNVLNPIGPIQTGYWYEFAPQSFEIQVTNDLLGNNTLKSKNTDGIQPAQVYQTIDSIPQEDYMLSLWANTNNVNINSLIIQFNPQAGCVITPNTAAINIDRNNWFYWNQTINVQGSCNDVPFIITDQEVNAGTDSRFDVIQLYES